MSTSAPSPAEGGRKRSAELSESAGKRAKIDTAEPSGAPTSRDFLSILPPEVLNNTLFPP